MKIENGYTKLAKVFGVELGQEFNIQGGRRNPYHFDCTGLYDADGCWVHIPLHSVILGELSIEICPLLTDKEKAFLKSISKLTGLPLHTVAVGKSPKGFQLLHVKCRKGKLDSFTTVQLFNNEFSQLDELYEYTPKELGLED